MNTNPANRTRTLVLICLVLATVTAAVYWPVHNQGFLWLDDPGYVTDNPHVLKGISWEGIVWAFTSSHAHNWHPLTWVSHMADCQLFGTNAGGHHVVNVGCHVLNSLLLFLFLTNTTGAVWRSAFVAGLFAWHPLHVESVAWVAERKDVLSTFWGLLTLWAYARYTAGSKVRSPKSRVFYGLALVLFAFGLMSKPMLVTWPFVLLLLDVWPLRRVQIAAFGAQIQTLKPLVWEKLPFFALSAISCVLTMIAQRDSVASLNSLPLWSRVANAIVSYVRYLAKTVWPANLAIFYPHPENTFSGSGPWPGWQIIGAATLLVAMCAIAVRALRTRPYVTVGWFWYLGTLLPAIGLVQVGEQAMADRYTYVPLIGIFIVIIWSLVELAGTSRSRRLAVAITAVATLVVCAAATRIQLRYWRDSRTLFQHAVRATSGSYVAFHALGTLALLAGETDEAIAQYRLAVQINPRNGDARNNLGFALARAGRQEEAIATYQTALQIDPAFGKARNNLGVALVSVGRTDEAVRQFLEALKGNPRDAATHNNLGRVLVLQGKIDDAITHYQAALAIDPQFAQTHLNLGRALALQGKRAEAIAHYSEAVRLQPDFIEAREGLATALSQAGQHDEAARQYSELLQLMPDNPNILCNLALALVMAGQPVEAVRHYREAIRLRPDWPVALNDLAWILATHPQAEVRNGTEAVRLAERSCELTHHQQPAFMETLAAAYAEAGRFTEAIAAAQTARELALAHGEKELAESNQQLIEQFRSGHPFRQ